MRKVMKLQINYLEIGFRQPAIFEKDPWFCAPALRQVYLFEAVERQGINTTLIYYNKNFVTCK
jgi:hypothetical protein